MDRVRLALGSTPHVVGLALGVGPQLRGLVLGGGTEFSGVNLRGGLDLVRLGPGGLDELGSLLLRQPEELFNPGAEARVGGTLLLLDLPVRIG